MQKVRLKAMKNSIKYYCYYDSEKKVVDRSYCLAATNKIDYITQVLNCSAHVDLISLAGGLNKSSYFNYLSGSTTQLDKFKTLKLFPSINSKFMVFRVLGRNFTKILLIYHLVFCCKRGESIIVYHSLGYANIFFILKKIKKIRLILEVEELYADVTGKAKDREKEIRLFDVADAFIFSTELLAESINITHKPYAVVYGTYKTQYDRNFRFDNDLTHVVYAGTLDPRKGGSAAAAAAAMYLDSSFHIHILGFGSIEEIENIKDQIKSIQEKSPCLITFDGLLSGERFIEFIQACDIGLSTQNPDAAFNATSFPSKILTYLSNGLKVVSIRIPAIEKSSIGRLVHYYDEQTPKNIADSIVLASKKESFDSRKKINELNEDFKQSLQFLLGQLV